MGTESFLCTISLASSSRLSAASIEVFATGGICRDMHVHYSWPFELIHMT